MSEAAVWELEGKGQQTDFRVVLSQQSVCLSFVSSMSSLDLMQPEMQKWAQGETEPEALSFWIREMGKGIPDT